MSALQAYVDGYDAYLRVHGDNGHGKPLTPNDEEPPPSPYVEDAKSHQAWLKGWKDAGGAGRLPRRSLARCPILNPPFGVAGFGAWPAPPRYAERPGLAAGAGLPTGVDFSDRMGR